MISLGQQKVTDEDSSTTTEDDLENTDKESDQGDDSDIDSVVEEDVPSDDDFDKEADIARKVLNNLITSSAKDESVNNDSVSSEEKNKPKSKETVKGADSKTSKESDKVSDISKPETSKETEVDLHRTVFITNLPFELDTEEVKQRFSAFGEVEYFAPVLHQVTKYVLEQYFVCVCVTQIIIHTPLLLNAGVHEGLVFLSLKPRKQLIMQFQLPILLLGWVFW